MATIKQLGEIKVVEIRGVGENISDETKRIFLSKSGLKIIEEYERTKESNPEEAPSWEDVINKLELYFNKNNKPILTAKKDKTKITINKYIESSYRGTSYIEETSEGVTIVSATGAGRLGEHTEFIATIPEGCYVIVYSGGRYHKGWTCFKNVEGELKTYEFYNRGKYVEKPDYEDAKIAFGLMDCACED